MEVIQQQQYPYKYIFSFFFFINKNISARPIILHMHDESIFHANDGERSFWGKEGDKVMKKKSLGSGIMVSDFINQQISWLQLIATQWEDAKKIYPDIPRTACITLEYGKNKESYFENKRFLDQVCGALQIATYLWPTHDHVWVFDHSGVHKCMGDDALSTVKMNLTDGGKQPHLHLTGLYCNVPVHCMNIFL